MGNLTAKTSGEIASFMSPSVTNIKSLKVHFSPKQLGTGDPSPENVRGIEGWDGVEVAKSSINLLDQSYITNASGWALSSDDGNTTFYGVPVYKGTIVKFYQKFKSGYPFVGNPFKENVQYNVSVWLKMVDGGSLQGLKFGFEYTDGTSSLHSIFSITGTWKRQTLTSKADKTVSGVYCSYNNSGEIYLCGLAVCEKEFDDTSVVYPSAVNNISIDWSNNIGTVYGGYVDLISGELVQDMRYKQITADALSNAGDSIGYTSSVTALNGQSAVWIRNLFNSTAKGRKSGGIKANCNAFKVLMNSTGVISSQNRTAFAVDSETITSVADFISAVETLEQNNNGLYLAYELATPITHQLTPTQLSSFIGQNNFWSNADYVEVEYDLIETIDIQKARKKIILNQPHIESVKGDLVNFNTNLRAPLKECKVYFEPIQEGKGDPNPDNIRPISGWTGMQLTQANENLIPESLPDNVITGAASGGKIAGASNAKIFAIPIPKNTPLYIQKISGDNSSGNVGLLEDGEPQVGDFWINNKGLTNAINQNYTANEYSWMGIQSYDLAYAKAWFTTRELMISVGNTRKEYVAPKGYSTQYISWQSETGIVYGGKLDVLNGKLMVTNYYCTPDNATQIRYGINSESNLPYAYFSFAQKAIGTSLSARTLCSMYKAGNVQNVDKALRMWTSEADIWDSDLDVTSLDTVKAYFADLIIVYPLAKPITIQLTPQQLFTLKGTNNIWSNSNGQTEVKFWTH